MTPEEKRIAIAEACGFASILQAPKGIWSARNHEELKLAIVPDYLNDLNAMHEAEMTLTADEADGKFYHWLGYVVSGGQETQLWEYRKLIVHATAAQRADAFLLTKGFEL